MKIKLFVVLLTIICAPPLSSQNIDKDTVFIKRSTGINEFDIDTIPFSPHAFQQILVGTTFLPYTPKIIQLLNNGIQPISVEVLSRCDIAVDQVKASDYPYLKKFIEKLTC